MYLFTGKHPYDTVEGKILMNPKNRSDWKPLPIRLKKGCWIGARVVILQDVTIGQGAVVGSGAVVTKDIADFHFAAGIPAKMIKGLREPS